MVIKPGKDSRSSHLKVMATLARRVWMVKTKLPRVEEQEVWEGGQGGEDSSRECGPEEGR